MYPTVWVKKYLEKIKINSPYRNLNYYVPYCMDDKNIFFVVVKEIVVYEINILPFLQNLIFIHMVFNTLLVKLN